VEVQVEPGTRRVRVPRVVSVADCGRGMSPRTAVSQVRGGVVWGIGAALREASEVDPRFGGFLNADLAEYVVPVNADIGSIEVDFIDEPDRLLNNQESRVSPRSRWPEWRPRSPMPCTTRRAAACATCRSGSSTCFEGGRSIGLGARSDAGGPGC
jgi:hypothetical protein